MNAVSDFSFAATGVGIVVGRQTWPVGHTQRVEKERGGASGAFVILFRQKT